MVDTTTKLCDLGPMDNQLAEPVGLKSFVPVLAAKLHRTGQVIYERQRALVGKGILAVTPGKGPGSGVRLMPETVAWLLIAIMCSDELRRVADRAPLIASLKPDED